MQGRILLLVTLGALVGCGPNIATELDEDEEEIGERPSEAGLMYSACSSVAMCRPLEFCVFPRGHDGDREAGYCAAACQAPGDPALCDPAPGAGATVGCLDIGIGDGREVCALDCGSGQACPAGMRCEGLSTSSGDRHICF